MGLMLTSVLSINIVASTFDIDDLDEQVVLFNKSSSENDLKEEIALYLKVMNNSGVKTTFNYLELGKNEHSFDEIYVDKFQDIVIAAGSKTGLSIEKDEDDANHDMVFNFKDISMKQYSIPQEYLKADSTCNSKFELGKQKSTEHVIKNIYSLEGSVSYSIVNKKSKNVIYEDQKILSAVNSTISFLTFENYLEKRSSKNKSVDDQYKKFMLESSFNQYMVGLDEDNETVISIYPSNKTVTNEAVLKIFKDHILDINELPQNEPILYVIKPTAKIYELNDETMKNIAYRRALINQAELSAFNFVEKASEITENDFKVVAVYKLNKAIPIGKSKVYSTEFIVKLKANTERQYDSVNDRTTLVIHNEDKNLLARIYVFDKDDGFVYGSIRNKIDGYKIKVMDKAYIPYSSKIISMSKILNKNLKSGDGTLFGIALSLDGDKIKIGKKKEGDLSTNRLEALSTTHAFDLALNVDNKSPEVNGFAQRDILHKGKLIEYISKKEKEEAEKGLYTLNILGKKYDEGVCTEMGSDDYAIYKVMPSEQTSVVIRSNKPSTYMSEGERLVLLRLMDNKYSKYFNKFEKNYYNYRVSAFDILKVSNRNFSSLMKQKLNIDTDIRNIYSGYLAEDFFDEYYDILKSEYAADRGTISLASHQTRMKQLERLLEFVPDYKNAENINVREYEYAIMNAKTQILILLAAEEGYGLTKDGLPNYNKTIELYFKAFPKGRASYWIGNTKRTIVDSATVVILIGFNFEFTSDSVYMPYAFLFSKERMEHIGLLDKMVENQKYFLWNKNNTKTWQKKVADYLKIHPIVNENK